MALELIKINGFEESVNLKEWLVTADANGIGYKISKANLEAELGISSLLQMGGAIVPTSTPEPTGDYFWIATEDGTYTSFGGTVVPANSIAIISRVGGVFSSSITTIEPQDLSGLVTKAEFSTVEPVSKMFIHGKNLFNKEDVQVDKYLTSTGTPGEISDGTGWICSPLIPLDDELIAHVISGSKDRKGAAYYDENGIPTRYFDINTGVIEANQANEKFLAFNLKSPTSIDYSNVQVEKGSTETDYEEYSVLINSESVAGLPESIDNSNLAIEKSELNEIKLNSFKFEVEASVNRINPANKRPDSLLDTNTGAWVTSINYNGLEFTRVDPSTEYKSIKSDNTVLTLRNIIFYDVDFNIISSLASNTNTFTTPVNCEYLQASIIKSQGGDFTLLAIVKTGASFEPYADLTVVKLINQSATVLKDNDELATISDVKSIAGSSYNDRDINWSVDSVGNMTLNYGDSNVIAGSVANSRGFSGNNMFNFQQTQIKGVTVASHDEVAPIHMVGGTIGANHGLGHWVATIAAHGFNDTIIGEEFTKDGIKFYPIRVVDANKIAFLSEYTGTINNFSFTNLTVGIISRGGVDYPITSVSAEQLYPSIGLNRLDVFVNDSKVGLGTSGNSGNIKVSEEYVIYNTADVLDNIKLRAGQNIPPDMTGSAICKVKNIYSFKADLSCVVTSEVFYYQSVPFVDIMGNQAVRIGGNPYYYLPNSNPIGTLDLRKPNQVVFNSSTPTIMVSRTNFEPGNPPNRVIQYSDNVGFMIGYIHAYNDINRTARMFEIRNNTGKIYPHPIEGTEVGATTEVGDLFDMKIYRVYTDLSVSRIGNRLSYFVVHDEGVSYIFVDYSGSVLDDIQINIPELNGEDLEIVEQRNTELLSKTFNNGFFVDATYIEGETCYIVLRINN